MSNDQRYGDGQGPQIPEIKMPKLDPTKMRAIFGVVLILLFAFTSFYTIDPEETGLVLRFGKFVRDASPGLHFKIPLGVEQVLKVPIQRQLKEEFGFRTVRAGVQRHWICPGSRR